MANAGKAKKITVLQALFDQVASELKYKVPLATAEIWSTFETLEFKAPNDFFLERGVNPYLVLVANDRLIHARCQVEEQQVLLEGGTNAAQLSNIRKLWNSMGRCQTSAKRSHCTDQIADGGHRNLLDQYSLVVPFQTCW